MPGLLTFFDPQPRPDELPARLPSPFAAGPPHPLARRAAEELQQQLRRGQPVSFDDDDRRGKMFGVLVVADREGKIGYLRAFSGMLADRWQMDGFVDPLFDLARRDAIWPAGEAELEEYDRRLAVLETGPEAHALRIAREERTTRQRAAADELAARHAQRRQTRQEERQTLEALPEDQRRVRLRELAEQSRADTVEDRRLKALHLGEQQTLAAAQCALDEARAALKQERAARSCVLLAQFWDGYSVIDRRCEPRDLRLLFAPEKPPGGSGDCAAPKLFGFAHRTGLRPIALAEFWWGAPPLTGGRRHGVYYPSCRGKCGPVLSYMLAGVDTDPLPVFGADEIPADQPRTVFEDRWLTVVDKPVGLLSVPGRSGALHDAVLTRLRARYPDATGAMLVHRLDLDTSGLLLAAKDPETYVALQRQFSTRGIDKRYIAWLEGDVRGDQGSVDLALRVDLDDRPRQIHDPLQGKQALTDWRVIERVGGRTRVALFPRTGRTHQLRVHAAHPLGLGAPIVGDRLYGEPGERLLLHAESLTFDHPHTGERLTFEQPAPF